MIPKGKKPLNGVRFHAFATRAATRGAAIQRFFLCLKSNVMQNQSFPCLELLSQLFHDFANKTTMNHFRLEKDEHKLIVLMPKPFQMILFTELFALEADQTLFNRVDMKYRLNVERLPSGLKVNGIKVVPHYKMELALYHHESILYQHGELCSVIELVPGEIAGDSVGAKIVFQIQQKFPTAGF